MYKPRDYQIDLIDRIFQAWQANRRLMLQLPTGGGKTVLFAHLALQFIRKGMGVLVLAHREELLLQAQEKLEAVTGLPTGIIKAGYPVHTLYELQVASIQSLVRRKYTPSAGLLIVDEAHHSSSKTYTELMERYPQAYILGCTATPHRIDGQGFKWLFDDLICGPSTKELIDRGYLSPYKLFQAAKVTNTAKVKSTGGDFNLGQLAQSVSSQIEPIDVVAEWKNRAADKKTVVFAVDVCRSQEYTEAFKSEGIAAEHLDGKTPKEERKAILERFATGQTLVLCNCGIVSEGFDLPAIECVQVVRPTKSLSMWLQIVGRGLRISEGKVSAIIIDHTKNWQVLGLPDEDRVWSLEPETLSQDDRFLSVNCGDCNHIYRPTYPEIKAAQDSKKTAKDPITKAIKKVGNATCPSCLAVNEFLIGTGGTGPNDKILDANAEGLEINLEIHPWHKEIINSLIEQKDERGYKKSWVYLRLKEIPETNPKFQLKNLSLGDWRYLAHKLEYKTGWAWRQYNETQSGESFDTPDHWSKTPIFQGLIEHLDTQPVLGKRNEQPS